VEENLPPEEKKKNKSPLPTGEKERVRRGIHTD
jgi:hypothetical protein